MSLSGKQKRHLRALGHNLKPVVLIGKKELDDSLIAETNSSLDHHELIKIKLLESCLISKQDAAKYLADACSAEIAQILGKTILLYRPGTTPVITFS